MIELYIREKRLEKNLTQDKLSELSGISKSYIGDLEINEKEPTISVLHRLAKALDVDIKELYRYYE